MSITYGMDAGGKPFAHYDYGTFTVKFTPEQVEQLMPLLMAEHEAEAALRAAEKATTDFVRPIVMAEAKRQNEKRNAVQKGR